MLHGPIGRCKLRATQQRIYGRNDFQNEVPVYKRRRRYKRWLQRNRLREINGALYEVQTDGRLIFQDKL